MPIFEYRCSACDHLEEVLQKHSDPGPAQCPVCGKQGTLAKEMSATSFQLKGGGWYKDLYASTSKKDASSETKSETKSEKKADTKSETKSEKKAEPKVEKAPKKEAASTSSSSTPSTSSSSASPAKSSSGGSSAA